MTDNTQARENARHDNGRFGEQSKTDPGAGILTPAPVNEWDVQKLMINFRLTPSYAEELLRRHGSHDAAEEWLRYDYQVGVAKTRLTDGRVQLAEAKHNLAGAATHGIAARVLRDHPNVTEIMLVRDPGQTHPRVFGRADGVPVGSIWDDDEMREDLEEFTADIDLDDDASIGEFCLEPVSRHVGLGGEVATARLDLRAFGIRPRL